MDQAEAMQQRVSGFFPETLGITFITVSQEKVVARLEVRDNLCTVPGILHGGAVMAFADTLGAVGTALNLPPGAGTTTLESKTNFFASGRAGTVITGESIPLHRGRRTMVWQTNVLSPEGKLIAQVTQTQMVLEG
jgi:uncharacterized protein (TIGR00369 family)